MKGPANHSSAFILALTVLVFKNSGDEKTGA
jgi:hypothetical protein